MYIEACTHLPNDMLIRPCYRRKARGAAGEAIDVNSSRSQLYSDRRLQFGLIATVARMGGHAGQSDTLARTFNQVLIHHPCCVCKSRACQWLHRVPACDEVCSDRAAGWPQATGAARRAHKGIAEAIE